MRSNWVLVIALLVGLVLVVAVLARLVVLVLVERRRPAPWGASTGLLTGRAAKRSPAGPLGASRAPASGHPTSDARTRDGGTRDASTRDVGAEVCRVARDVGELQLTVPPPTAPGQDDGPVLDDMDSQLDAVFEAADLRWPD